MIGMIRLMRFCLSNYKLMNIKKYVIDAVSTLLLYNNRDNVDYALELLDRVDKDIKKTQDALWKERVRFRYRRLKNYAKSKNQ